MGDYTVKRLDEMEAIFGGSFRRAGAALGVESFAMQIFDMPAGESSATGAPEPAAASSGARSGGRVPLVVPVCLLVAIIAALSVVLLSGSGRRALPGGAHQGSAGGGYAGLLAEPAKPAPPLSL